MHRLVFAAVAAVVSLAASAAETKAELPILGWHGMPCHLVTVERYAQAKDAGFTHLMQWAPDLKESLRVLDCAQKAGIRLLLHSPCIEGERPEEAVKVLKAHPGLGLYHLCDEPVAAKLPAIGARAKRIMAADPAHPCYMNWCGVVGRDPMRWYGAPDYRSYIEVSRREVPIQMISFDKYPLIADAGKYKEPFRDLAETSLKTNWFETLEIVREVSRREKVPFWAFAISTAHRIGSNVYFPGGHAYPTATVAGMRLQQYANLAYGAQGLQYFTFWGVGGNEMNFHDSPFTLDGHETFVLDRIRAVNAELQARAFVFVGAVAKEVWHTGGTIQPSTRRLPERGLPKGVERLEIDGAAIVSHLVNGRSEYLMVVCTELNRATTLKVAFADGVRRIRPDGRAVPAKAHAGEYRLEPGDCEIFVR